MKLFINDWNGDRDSFIMNVEENSEHPINAWVTSGDGSRVYLASAYVYDEFVMFFYVYDRKYSCEYAEPAVFKISQTNRDLIARSPKNLYRMAFEYEANHLKAGRGSSGECLPRQKPENVPEEEPDEFFEMYFGEYDYLCDIMKDRLPEELQGLPIAFKKDCFSFAEPVNRIEHIAIFPSSHEVRRHFIDKTFTMPYGECEIKIPYLADGAQSYIILRELKVFDMLKAFEEHYDEFVKARENSLLELEKSKGKGNQTVMDLDEMRKYWDKRLLTLSYTRPEEKRSFEFYTTEYLNAKISSAANGSTAVAYILSPDKDDRVLDGLYKGVSVLGEVNDTPNAEYEITLLWMSEPVGHERKAVFLAESF